MERLNSAFIGESHEAIAKILSYFPTVKTVLDPTYGKGVFYKSCPFLSIIGKDLELDFRHLPFKDASFDAVIIDPPYQQGGRASAYEGSYGLWGRSTNNLIAAYIEGIYEGLRVATGIVIAKCADAVESGKFVPVATRIISSVNRPLWDMLIVVRYSSMTHPSWKTVEHFRHNYAYYLVWRK